MQIEERFYSSTEVAEILGVSLRSIYRYLEEGKLDAEIKTATGRHRFTKQNIMDFLYPSAQNSPVAATKAETSTQVAPSSVAAPVEEQQSVASSAVQDTQNTTVKTSTDDVQVEVKVEEKVDTSQNEEVKEEEVDWLKKFREAAERYRAEENAAKDQVKTEQQHAPKIEEPEPTAKVSNTEVAPEPQPEPKQTAAKVHYRSGVGGLKDVAQNLDSSARKASVPYAFTMQAGMSLHKPINPFSLLHAYAKPSDKDFFEKMLKLTPVTKDEAQLCLIYSDDAKVFSGRKELHGLYVVADDQLLSDLKSAGEDELASDLAKSLS